IRVVAVRHAFNNHVISAIPGKRLSDPLDVSIQGAHVHSPPQIGALQILLSGKIAIATHEQERLFNSKVCGFAEQHTVHIDTGFEPSISPACFHSYSTAERIAEHSDA